MAIINTNERSMLKSTLNYSYDDTVHTGFNAV